MRQLRFTSTFHSQTRSRCHLCSHWLPVLCQRDHGERSAAQNMPGHCLERDRTMTETRLTLSCYRRPGPVHGPLLGECHCRVRRGSTVCLGLMSWKNTVCLQDLLGDELRTGGVLARGCCAPVVPILLGTVQCQTKPVADACRRASLACARHV